MPDLREVLLHGRERLAAALGGVAVQQLQRQAVGIARLGEHLLGLVRVVRVRVVVLGAEHPRRQDVRQRRGHLRAAEHLDDVGAVDRVRDRLADLDVGQRLVVVRRAQVVDEVRARRVRLGEREVGVARGQQPGDLRRRRADVEHHVRVGGAGLQLLLDRLLALRLVEDDLVDERAADRVGGRVPRGVAGQLDALRRLVLVHFVRPVRRPGAARGRCCRARGRGSRQGRATARAGRACR